MAQGSVTQANQWGQSTLIALSNYRGPLLMLSFIAFLLLAILLVWVFGQNGIILAILIGVIWLFVTMINAIFSGKAKRKNYEKRNLVRNAYYDGENKKFHEFLKERQWRAFTWLAILFLILIIGIGIYIQTYPTEG